MSVLEKQSLSDIFVKGNDYGTEEWAKQLIQNVTTKKLYNSNAFVGTIIFPSDEFLNRDLQQHQTVQFQNSMYVGYMDFLFPVATANLPGMGYTKVDFNLNGVQRSFIKVSQPNISNNAGQTFNSYILGLYPTANRSMCWSRHGMCYLSDIVISGGYYQLNNGVFEQIQGAFTPFIDLEIFVSGYKMQFV